MELAKRYGSPTLELACGTGRISLMLAQAEYEITGIELSPEMLVIARERQQQLPEDAQAGISFIHGYSN
ncbi:class I SAM-dependent methyltransferase [Candidatus Thorarchaeota archaeon]|nr:MAG: class I SAM-dependent methyltransferase [Candidatus Thorarchaeota archaeon]